MARYLMCPTDRRSSCQMSDGRFWQAHRRQPGIAGLDGVGDSRGSIRNLDDLGDELTIADSALPPGGGTRETAPERVGDPVRSE
jgi:hypothetical protein